MIKINTNNWTRPIMKKENKGHNGQSKRARVFRNWMGWTFVFRLLLCLTQSTQSFPPSQLKGQMTRCRISVRNESNDGYQLSVTNVRQQNSSCILVLSESIVNWRVKIWLTKSRQISHLPTVRSIKWSQRASEALNIFLSFEFLSFHYYEYEEPSRDELDRVDSESLQTSHRFSHHFRCHRQTISVSLSLQPPPPLKSSLWNDVVVFFIWQRHRRPSP